MSSVAQPTAVVEVASCPMCGCERFRTAFSEDPYSIRRCRRCGHGWASPRLGEAELAALYSDDRYWRSRSPRTLGYHDYRADEPLYLDTFRRRLAHVLDGVCKRGRALDVGCAAGFCMAVARELGFEVHGVEVSAAIAAHARESLGLDTVRVGTLEQAGLPDGHFQLVTMWDVIEHVVDPEALLAQARRVLAPDGLLVVETQDIDSAFARLLGRRWHHYKHAEHIHHFTPASASALLARAGFCVQRLTHRHAGKYVSFAFVAERAARVHPLLSGALAPLGAIRSGRVYVNLMDEMILLARPAQRTVDQGMAWRRPQTASSSS